VQRRNKRSESAEAETTL